MKNVNKIVCGIAALYLLSLVALTPIASAQATDKPVSISVESVGVSGTGAGNRLAPETATATVTAKFKVTIPGPSACVGQLITVTYKVLEKPTYATVTLAPTSESKPFTGGSSGQNSDQFASSGGYEWTGWETKAVVAFTRQAPAFQDIPIKIQGTVTAGSGTSNTCSAVTGSSNTANAETSIKADYLPSVQILPDAIIQTSGQNKKVLFPVTVINFSNGPTRIASEVIERTKGLNAVVPPAELFLESKATSGEKAQNTQQTFVTVLTPNKNGYTNKVYSFDIVFRARSDTAGQDLLTQEISVPLSAKVQGVYVPGFDSVSMIAGLGIALVGLGAMRRRHE